jgi:hypothetical protein
MAKGGPAIEQKQGQNLRKGQAGTGQQARGLVTAGLEPASELSSFPYVSDAISLQ